MRSLAGTAFEAEALASDLSAEGAFIRTASPIEPGSTLRLAFEIPSDPIPIEVAARVVRRGAAGVGVRFEELSARDRSRLRGYARYDEMDDAIVRVQQRLGDLVPGNLLPLGDHHEIINILRGAVAQRLEITLLRFGRELSPLIGRLDELNLSPAGAAEPAASTFEVAGVDLPADAQRRVVYLAFTDGALYYACEAIVLRSGSPPQFAVPARIYLTERRTGNRALATDATLVLAVPNRADLRLQVIDLSDGGAAVVVPANTPLAPGTRLPQFVVENGAERRTIESAVVRHVGTTADGNWRLGLHFATSAERDAFEHLHRRQLAGKTSPWRTLRTGLGLLRARLGRALSRSKTRLEQGVEIVRFPTRRDTFVTGIVDANFDTSDESVRPDLAIVIASPLLARKESLTLLARTLLDDLAEGGRRVVVLRFDWCHQVGESTMDPELLARDTPYLNYDLYHLVADLEASVLYAERRFRPAKRALVSLSLGALAARRVVAELERPKIDHWVAPFGVPTHRDMTYNYLAGVDVYELLPKNEEPEVIYIYGRPMRTRPLLESALALGLATLEQARDHLSRITTPVTWIVGTYDYWVTRSEVRAMLQAPGGGVREVFECATGHVMKQGNEAIELFKLTSESVRKHIFGEDRPARDPDLARFTLQSNAEWARVKRHRVQDSLTFWREHLFGTGDGVFYDVLLEHPGYVEFLERQAELLGLQAGHDAADLGCGTGNLAIAMLQTLNGRGPLRSLTVLDLVPGAVERTAEKVRAARNAHPPGELRTLVDDLEVSRFVPIQEFLSGRLYGPEELVGRVTGLEAHTAAKLSRSYGKEMHSILRGSPATTERVRQLCPELLPSEAEVVVELGRAARFVLERSNADDLRPSVAAAATAADLRFEHLDFGHAPRRYQLPLPGASLDRIGCSLVLPYLVDAITTLREFHRLLRPGGVLVISSLRPNFDPSKLYYDEMLILNERAGRGDHDALAKIEALRGFVNMVGRLLELEEDGRFHFWSGAQLHGMLIEAGFTDVHAFDALGHPPTTVVVRAQKPA